jgi:hypothetical protein
MAHLGESAPHMEYTREGRLVVDMADVSDRLALVVNNYQERAQQMLEEGLPDHFEIMTHMVNGVDAFRNVFDELRRVAARDLPMPAMPDTLEGL